MLNITKNCVWKVSSEIRRERWWLYCVFGTIVFGLILYYLHPSTDQDNARYILSAISQGLAAILALVFTITLVVAQMTRKYTAMDKIIFRPETIVLMIIFGLGIVIPLLVLRFGFFGVGVTFSILIATFCVFSLIPFLKGVNDVLKYDIGIGNLNEEILEAIDLNQRPRLSNTIDEIDEISESALRDSREDVVLFISQALSTAGIRSAKKEELWPEAYQLVEVLINPNSASL
jgi:hypothetical protein